MTLSLGGTTLPQVAKDGFTGSRELAGRYETAEDGTLVFFSTTTTGRRRVYRLEWKGMTAAQLTTIDTACNAAIGVGKSLVTPAGETVTVMCTEPAKWSAEKLAGGVYYHITATLSEVTPA